MDKCVKVFALEDFADFFKREVQVLRDLFSAHFEDISDLEVECVAANAKVRVFSVKSFHASFEVKFGVVHLREFVNGYSLFGELAQECW